MANRVPTYSAAGNAIREPKTQGNQRLLRAASAQMCPHTANSGLVAHLSEQGIAMRRSRISEIFIQEGLKWRHEETWFGMRVDPDFAQKRGLSSASIQQHQPAASSSASTKWDRKPARATRASGL
jgi:hypothetical protein